MNWNRPDSIPYPNIWHTFDGLRKINGNIPKFWIQDVTEDMKDAIVSMMLNGFALEEPLCKYSKFVEDANSVAEVKELYSHLILNKLTVVCLTRSDNDKPQLVGITCLARLSKDDKPLQFQGRILSNLRTMVDYAYSVQNPFKFFGIDEFLVDKGIYVVPEFRGQGICYEFLQIWPIICKTVRMKVVIGSFTSIASQKVAAKAEYKELISFKYEDLGKVDPRFVLPGIQEHTEKLRLLYKIA